MTQLIISVSLIFQKHRPALSQDELTTVRQTLQSQGIEVDAEFVSILYERS